jgi:hypothetical protein
MTICSEAIETLSRYISVSLDCGPNVEGYEAIRTPFMYPDRDNIELFISETNDNRIIVSDLGQTIMKLAEYGFLPHQAPRRRAMIYEIVSSNNVAYDDGSVYIVTDAANIGHKTWDLLLSLQRLSDLVFTVPAYTKATFTDIFENFMTERSISYQRGVQVALETGYRFTADFVVRDTKVVQLLSTGSPGYARERLDRVTVSFTEMKVADDNRLKVAILDDTQPVWEQQLLIPLQHQADRILRWTRKGDIEEVLAA